MNLSDLLVTYNLVKAPTEVVNQLSNLNNLPNPNSSKFERFIEYLNTKKDKESSNNPSNTVKEEEVGFPGWENSGVSSGNDLSKTTGTTVSRSPNNTEVPTDNDLLKAAEAASVSRKSSNNAKVSSVPKSSNNGKTPTASQSSARFCDLDNFDFEKEWNLAIQQEPKTVTNRLSDYQNSDKLKQYKEDLAKFYTTSYGQKFNPNANGISSEIRKKRQILEDLLLKIAVLESGFNRKARNGNAFGYFLLLKSTIENYKDDNGVNYNYENVINNPSLQFEIAYRRLLDTHRELLSWEDKKIHSGTKFTEFVQFTPFLKVYAHWWRPKSVMLFFKDNWTDKDKDDLGQTLGGMNILRILARARE